MEQVFLVGRGCTWMHKLPGLLMFPKHLFLGERASDCPVVKVYFQSSHVCYFGEQQTKTEREFILYRIK